MPDNDIAQARRALATLHGLFDRGVEPAAEQVASILAILMTASVNQLVDELLAGNHGLEILIGRHPELERRLTDTEDSVVARQLEAIKSRLSRLREQAELLTRRRDSSTRQPQSRWTTPSARQQAAQAS